MKYCCECSGDVVTPRMHSNGTRSHGFRYTYFAAQIDEPNYTHLSLNRAIVVQNSNEAIRLCVALFSLFSPAVSLRVSSVGAKKQTNRQPEEM